MFWRVRSLAVGVSALVCFAFAQPAHAQVGYAFYASTGSSVSLLGTANPIVSVSDVSDRVDLNFYEHPSTTNVTYGPTSTSDGPLFFSSESASTHMWTNIDGLPGTKMTYADMTVNGLDFETLGISFTADSISSVHEISGDGTVWTPTESTSIVNGHLSVNGTDVALPSNPSPNDLIYDQNGLQIRLNSGSIGTFDGGSPIDFRFYNYKGPDGVLYQGAAFFGFSGAGLAPVPEPTSLLAFAPLVGGLLLRKKRRR